MIQQYVQYCWENFWAFVCKCEDNLKCVTQVKCEDVGLWCCSRKKGRKIKKNRIYIVLGKLVHFMLFFKLYFRINLFLYATSFVQYEIYRTSEAWMCFHLPHGFINLFRFANNLSIHLRKGLINIFGCVSNEKPDVSMYDQVIVRLGQG